MEGSSAASVPGPLAFTYDPLVYERGVPLAAFARLREEGAVCWVPEDPLPAWPGGSGFWLVLRHAEAGSALRDAKTFSSQRRGTQLRDPATAEDLAYVRQMMLNMDPPDHTRLRRMLIGAFTSRAIGELEARIREHAEHIVDEALGEAGSGELDFVSDLASDMPLRCLADIFGLPREDRYLMYDWANRVIGYQDPDYAASSAFAGEGGSPMAREALTLRPQPDPGGRLPDPRSRDGMPDLYRYAHLLAEYKRRHPGADVMSNLLAQLDDVGGRLSVTEFENMFWLFSVAGNETLRNGIPGGMIALLEHPQAWHALREDRSLLPGAVEEMLRWWTPVMNFRRTVAAPVTLGGVAMAPGDKVQLSFLSANRDERVFEAPEQFRIDRQPNPHLSFGYGPHFCIGAQLAVAQMTALFDVLLSRLEEVAFAGEPRYLRSNFQRGVKTLPLRWRRAP
jgi:cytochrome P450